MSVRLEEIGLSQAGPVLEAVVMTLGPVADHFNDVADIYDEIIPFFSSFAAAFDQRITWLAHRQRCWTWVAVGEP